MCRMTIDDTSVALVNAHLAAGQNKIRSRNADLTAIIEGKGLFAESEEVVERDAVAYVGGGDGSTVLDHEIVFVRPFSRVDKYEGRMLTVCRAV